MSLMPFPLLSFLIRKGQPRIAEQRIHHGGTEAQRKKAMHEEENRVIWKREMRNREMEAC
jgi:hypothetical protein